MSVPLLPLAATAQLPAQRACIGISDCLWIKKHFQLIPSSCQWHRNAGTYLTCVHSLWREYLCIKCFNKTHCILSKLFIFWSSRATLLLPMEWGENHISNAVCFVWSHLCRKKALYPARRACVRTVTTTTSSFPYFYFGKTKWLKATAVDLFRCRRKPLAHWTLKMRFLCAKC